MALRAKQKVKHMIQHAKELAYIRPYLREVKAAMRKKKVKTSAYNIALLACTLFTQRHAARKVRK